MDSSLKSISKSELADMLGVSTGTLRRYLNKDIYAQIVPLGYKKQCHLLNGAVLEFIKLHYCL